MTEIFYCTILDRRNNELLAIFKSPVPHHERSENKIIEQELGSEEYWWIDIVTQAEYETYQAFGIKEIKL